MEKNYKCVLISVTVGEDTDHGRVLRWSGTPTMGENSTPWSVSSPTALLSRDVVSTSWGIIIQKNKPDVETTGLSVLCT
jgi:hypothetical protein